MVEDNFMDDWNVTFNEGKQENTQSSGSWVELAWMSGPCIICGKTCTYMGQLDYVDPSVPQCSICTTLHRVLSEFEW